MTFNPENCEVLVFVKWLFAKHLSVRQLICPLRPQPQLGFVHTMWQ